MTDDQSRQALQGGLQRYMEDVSIEVPFHFVNAFACHNASIIASSLRAWADSGQLKIVRAPVDCAPSDICIVLLRALDIAPPCEGFVRQINAQIMRCEYLTDGERLSFVYPSTA